jgi:hypothetical protein
VAPPERTPFASFLGRALAALRSEAPRAFSRLGAAAGRDGVRIDVDGPAVVLRFEGDRFDLAPDAGPASVEVRSDRATILALIDGEVRLLDAILDERLGVRGPVDAVLRFDAALTAFLDGAVRAPSLPTLLAAFRTGGSAPAEELPSCR